MNDTPCAHTPWALCIALGQKPDLAVPAGHVESCAACRAAIDDARLIGVILDADRIAPPAELARRTIRKVLASSGGIDARSPFIASSPEPPGSPSAIPIVPMVLALSAALMFALIVLHPEPRDTLASQPDINFRPRDARSSGGRLSARGSRWRSLDADGVEMSLEALRTQLCPAPSVRDEADWLLRSTRSIPMRKLLPTASVGADIVSPRETSVEDFSDQVNHIRTMIEEVNA